MNIGHLLNEQCTLIKRVKTEDTDELGNPVFSESTTAGVQVHLQQVAGTMGSNGVYYTGKAYFDAGVSVAEDDRITAHGKTFWVNSVQLHVSPYCEPSYISCELRETEERRR